MPTRQSQIPEKLSSTPLVHFSLAESSSERNLDEQHFSAVLVEKMYKTSLEEEALKNTPRKTVGSSPRRTAKKL